MSTQTTQPAPQQLPPGIRRRLPNERKAITHRFSIAGCSGYLTVGMYPTGEPGEIFIRVAKCGSTLSGLLDSLAISVSLGLQYGIPLKIFADKYIDSRFEPSGFSGPEFGEAKSIVDYVFRFLVARFPTAGVIQ